MIEMLPDLQASTLGRIVSVLQGEARIEAILGGGSMVHGGFDEQSDLDLVVVVAADGHGAVMAERRGIAGQVGRLLLAFTGEHVGEPRLLICLFGPPLVHVDLKFVVATDLHAGAEMPVILWARDAPSIQRRLDVVRVRRAGPDPQWFEDRAWTWLHYGAAKLLRGEYFEALSTIDFFRTQVLGPLLQRNGRRPQRGVRRIEEVPEAADRLQSTLAGIDRASLAAALRQCTALYVELRQFDPPSAPTTDMPALLLDFIGPVE